MWRDPPFLTDSSNSLQKRITELERELIKKSQELNMARREIGGVERKAVNERKGVSSLVYLIMGRDIDADENTSF